MLSGEVFTDCPYHNGFITYKEPLTKYWQHGPDSKFKIAISHFKPSFDQGHILLHTVKSTVKISSVFVAYIENTNFKNPKNSSGHT